ncbi:fimbria/pilus periplasmic chaperone [Bordetella genomosp. 12]|uniref:Molecular chaperone EcpD n=1 Tax=Bordetella genomosp. 12 TaxID=463035 RepID=A0A261VVQ5_9BORD|nr:fimbria/pilus periplasmic chaperone [Bordetella genomosp. 12]OZI77690.1 molecular chaperone EcpD [Bordetella genomosp. 12]
MKLPKKLKLGFGLACLLLAGGADASVIIGGTRVVYPLDQREVTVRLENDSASPSLVQVWLDNGEQNAQPGDVKAPFVITPPIFRMDAKKRQTLRIMHTGGEALPQDRESVYWLNVLDIPPKPDVAPGTNTMQVAYRTRVKLFVRPDNLPGKADEAPAQLDWKIVDGQGGKGQSLSVSNPTPYHVSFSQITVQSGGQTFKNEVGGMVAPKATQVLPVTNMKAVSAGAKVKYSAINDYGGAIVGEATLGR